MTGMCGPKSGVWKMTLTVTLRDIKRDPYSDPTVKFDTLTLTFRCIFLMGTTLDGRNRRKFFLITSAKSQNATDSGLSVRYHCVICLRDLSIEFTKILRDRYAIVARSRSTRSRYTDRPVGVLDKDQD